MTVQGWTLTGVIVGLLALMLVMSQPILTPFVAGLVLAYILSPLVERLERAGLPRSLASALPVAMAIVILGVALALLLPLLSDQVTNFVRKLPGYMTELQNSVLPKAWVRKLQLTSLNTDAVLRMFGVMGGDSATWVATNLSRLYSGAVATFNLFTLVIMTPLVAFYLVHDWPELEPRLLKALPKKWKSTVVEMVDKVDVRLSAYLRGQLLVCLISGVFYGTALELIGLELGWALGLMAGVLVFIPVIGAMIAVVGMFAMALVQYQLTAWEPYAAVAGIYVLGQVLEGSVLTPLLVGNRVGLHPVWVIFALMLGGEIAGITGMLLAIPLAVIVSVILPYVIAGWHKSVT